jgi:hypothetical protein
MNKIPDMFYDQLIKFWRYKLVIDIDPTSFKAIYYYVMSGIFGTIKMWSDGTIQLNKHELSKLIFKVSTFGVTSFLDEQDAKDKLDLLSSE